MKKVGKYNSYRHITSPSNFRLKRFLRTLKESLFVETRVSFKILEQSLKIERIARGRVDRKYTRYVGIALYHGEPARKIALVVVGVPLRTLHRTAKEPAISSCTTMRHYTVAKARRTLRSVPVSRLSQFTI